MDQPCTVIIAPAEHLAALKERLANGGEVFAFADTDTTGALAAIIERRPQVIAVERLFSATSRGVSLINRLKADPTLAESEIRVLAHQHAHARVSPCRQDGAAAAAVATAPAPPPALDLRGTRRAPRFRIREGVDVLIDGNPVALVDLSTVGAQVMSPAVLRPNQRVRVVIPESQSAIRFKATVSWARFEMASPATAPRYRVGLEFIDADPDAVEDFALRNRRADTQDSDLSTQD